MTTITAWRIYDEENAEWWSTLLAGTANDWRARGARVVPLCDFDEEANRRILGMLEANASLLTRLAADARLANDPALDLILANLNSTLAAFNAIAPGHRSRLARYLP